jgi:hypothetical protein
MERRVGDIPTSYAVSADDSGTPVYFGSVEAPQRFQIANDGGLNVVAEPRLISEAVQCIKKFKNPSVRVTEYADPNTTGPFHFSRTIVLFDKKSTLDSVYYGIYMPVEVTPDFRNIDRDGLLSSCVTLAYMKIRNKMNSDIADTRWSFYTNSAIFLIEVLLAEIAFCASAYWILRGFFGRRDARSERSPQDQ